MKVDDLTKELLNDPAVAYYEAVNTRKYLKLKYQTEKGDTFIRLYRVNEIHEVELFKECDLSGENLLYYARELSREGFSVPDISLLLGIPQILVSSAIPPQR